MLLEEPWFSFILLLGSVVGILGGAFVQDWLADRAAARRARDLHSAE